MDLIKAMAGVAWAVIIGILILFIGLVPNFIFQIQGWAENPDLDLLSRCLGFIIVLFLISWYCNKKN